MDERKNIQLLCENSISYICPDSSEVCKVTGDLSETHFFLFSERWLPIISRNTGNHCFFTFFIQQVLISHQFYTHQCIHVNPNRPIHRTTPCPAIFPPWCPYVCSLHLCLNFCPANWLTCTIFLGSTYALIYDICFSLSDLLHSV